MTLEKRWQIQSPITSEADSALVKFPPLLRQVLFNRGYFTDAAARAFLKAAPEFNSDPFQLTGMSLAVERIRFAIKGQEQMRSMAITMSMA
jgi:hypothetical protein